MPASRKLQLATGLGYHVLEWGDGDHTVVLIHGFLDFAPLVPSAMRARTETFRIFGEVIRGHEPDS